MNWEDMSVGMLQSKRKATGLFGNVSIFISKIFINPQDLSRTELTQHEIRPTCVGLPRDGRMPQLDVEYHFAVNNCRKFLHHMNSKDY